MSICVKFPIFNCYCDFLSISYVLIPVIKIHTELRFYKTIYADYERTGSVK